MNEVYWVYRSAEHKEEPLGIHHYIRGVDSMGALKEVHRKTDYRKMVEEMLRLYPIYIKSLLAKTELMPSMAVNYEERVTGGYKEYVSDTEQFGIMRADRRLLVQRLEYAFGFLGETELNVIKAAYFPLEKPYLNVLLQQLQMSERTYFRTKRRALEKIELALRLAGMAL